MEFKPYNDLDEIEPTLIMDNQFSKDFLLEFSRALNQAGYSDNSTDAFANELKATKYHLEDMRTLVLRKEERTI